MHDLGAALRLPHVSKVRVHCTPIGEVVKHAVHEIAEAAVGERLIVEDNQQRGDQIAHALHVTNILMFPYICGYHIAQLVQILIGEIPIVSIAALHILLDSV